MQVFFIESVCDDPEIIEANTMVTLNVIKLLIMLDYYKYFTMREVSLFFPFLTASKTEQPRL